PPLQGVEAHPPPRREAGSQGQAVAPAGMGREAVAVLHRILTAIAAVAAVLLLWVIAVMAAGLRRRLAGRPAAAGTWRADVLREPAPQVPVISYHHAPAT